MSVLSGTAAILLAIAAFVALYALTVEPYRVRLTRVEVPVTGLPDSLDGFTICHIADMHLSGYGYFERRLETLLASLDVDICAITGDVLNDPAGQGALIRLIAALRPRLGAYVVPGNNDYRGCPGGKSRLTGLAVPNVTILANKSERVCWNRTELTIIGLDDPFLGLDDLDTAMAGVGNNGFRLLLAHSPDIVKKLSGRRVDLILAGHTHGGQICLPWLGPIWLHCRYRLGLSAGLYDSAILSDAAGSDIGAARMYVTRGLSSSLVRVRFLCPPEVALLTLRPV